MYVFLSSFYLALLKNLFRILGSQLDHPESGQDLACEDSRFFFLVFTGDWPPLCCVAATFWSLLTLLFFLIFHDMLSLLMLVFK